MNNQQKEWCKGEGRTPCVPACQQGYVCINGKCVRDINPDDTTKKANGTKK